MHPIKETRGYKNSMRGKKGPAEGCKVRKTEMHNRYQQMIKEICVAIHKGHPKKPRRVPVKNASSGNQTGAAHQNSAENRIFKHSHLNLSTK